MDIEVSIQVGLGDFQLDAQFKMPAVGVTAIYGPSGCGKTTLLRAIAGLQEIDQGRVTVVGEPWNSGATKLAVHRRNVGYVFQEPSLFEHLDVLENLRYGLKRCAFNSTEINFEEICELLDLGDLLQRSVQTLSGGEQQRVAIGRALLANPKLLLMDEPLASLDQARKKEILPYLDRLHRRLAMPILYVSHALDEVVRLADNLILMDKGRVTASGPLLQVLEQQAVIEDSAYEPFTLLQAKVLVQRSEHQLTEVQAGDLLIRMPSMELERGQEVRLSLAAKDISLSLVRAEDSSILNIFAAEVVSIEQAKHPSQCLVKLNCGEINLLSQVSLLSREKLGLERGTRLYAQIKAASLLQ